MDSGGGDVAHRKFTFKKMSIPSTQRPRELGGSETCYLTSSSSQQELYPGDIQLTGESDDERTAILVLYDPLDMNERERIVKIIVESEEDATLRILPAISSNSQTFEVKEVANDGNSFYRSISYLTFGVVDKHRHIRKAVYRYMIDTRNDLILNKRCHEITGTPNIKTYVLRNTINMRSGEACEMELHIAALMLQTTIYVFESDIKVQPKVYRADGFDSRRAMSLYRDEIGGFRPVVNYHARLDHERPKPATYDEEHHESVSADDYYTTEDTTSESISDTVTVSDSEEEESTYSELFVDTNSELTPVKYRYAEGLADDSAEMIVTFDSDDTKSKQENVKDAVAAVFREKRRPRLRLQSFIVGPEGSGKITVNNVMKEWNYSVLIEILNRYPKLFNSKGMLTHLKQVVRRTPLFELKDNVALSNPEADKIRTSVVRMRAGLMPFKPHYVYRAGTQKEVSGTLRYGCLAFPSSNRNDFAYYHSQRPNATWTPIPVNPHVFKIVHEFQPRKTLVVGDNVYALVGKKLVIVNLFGTDDITSLKLPCKNTMNVFLVRSNRHQLYLINARTNKYSIVSESGCFSQWYDLANIDRQSVPGVRSQQLLLWSPNASCEIVVIPAKKGNKELVLSDIYADPSQSPAVSQINEYVIMDYLPENEFKISNVDFGLQQVKLSAYREDDTQYLLVEAPTLNQAIVDQLALDDQ